ncbi:MAG: deoxyribonuclease IV [Actinomycetota bacterium]|nr:deoxyribonuclease IV [Actinomycetota bacterium]
MRFGAHVSIANHLYDAVDRAASIGCDAMQIFPGNPRGWHSSYFDLADLDEFRRRRELADIRPLVIHLPYLVNLGAPTNRVFEASIAATKDSLAKAVLVDADFLVVHVGSHVGAGREYGLQRINAGLKEVLTSDFGRAKLLLENTAGAGFTLGSRLEEIAEIVNDLDKDPRLGICLDTCHAYAAGYDLSDPATLDDFIKKLDDLIGLDRIGVIHANDCRGTLGDHLDRHEQIGHGAIGRDGFRAILKRPEFQEMTFIIETPRPEAGDDIRNLEVLRSLAGIAESPT